MDLDTQITISLGQIVTGLLAVCAGITAVAAAWAVLLKAWRAYKAPETSQNARLAALEAAVGKHAEYLDADNKRIKRVEGGQRREMRALLALVRHALDGNDIEALKKSDEELHDFLLNQ